MTEAEWGASTDPRNMLFSLRGRVVSDRKLRLFAVACCRRIEEWTRAHDTPTQRWPWGVDARDAVSVAERFADGEATDYRLNCASVGLVHCPRWQAPGIRCDRRPYRNPFQDVVEPSAERAAWRMLRIPDAFVDPEPPVPDDPVPTPAAVKRGQESTAQSDLLRDILGYPFRPLVFAPAWRTETAVSLACQMYDSRDFSVMPILADALQDAGCDYCVVLDHCRGPGLHVRGCWVVDLLLEKM
jgi:hypothetical protein